MAFFKGDFYSNELQMTTALSVIIPEGSDNKSLNVVYLLHGLSDNNTAWTRYTSVERYANEHHVAVIMPEVQRSFYTDMEYGMNYFSYVTKELPTFIHAMFNLPIDRDYSYVMGLSMGGYGALKTALTYPEKYKGCAAFSAACDVQQSVNDKVFESAFKEFTATFGMEKKVTDCNDLFKLAQKANESKLKPKIFMTCGTEDFLYQHNQKFKAHMESLNFEYNYQEWEGNHTWSFWDASIQMAFDYFFDEEE